MTTSNDWCLRNDQLHFMNLHWFKLGSIDTSSFNVGYQLRGLTMFMHIPIHCIVASFKKIIHHSTPI